MFLQTKDVLLHAGKSVSESPIESKLELAMAIASYRNSESYPGITVYYAE